MSTAATASAVRVSFRGNTASELMTPAPICVRETDSLKEAIAILVDKGIHAVPVVDDTGEPVGVLSATDVVPRHEHEAPAPSFYGQTGLTGRNRENLSHGFQVEETDRRQVGNLMSPVIYSVPADATPERVLSDLLGLRVHQLFVVDRQNALVGVVSALDLLRHMDVEHLDEASADEPCDSATSKMVPSRIPARHSMLLSALSAADLMNTNPISLREDSTVDEASELLATKGFSAAPVINAAGRPVGVISQSDLLIHEREQVHYLTPAGRQPVTERMFVRDLMTPIVVGVTLDTPVQKVVVEMLAMRVHRLFVLDNAGILVGVISALDILRHFQMEQS